MFQFWVFGLILVVGGVCVWVDMVLCCWWSGGCVRIVGLSYPPAGVQTDGQVLYLVAYLLHSLGSPHYQHSIHNKTMLGIFQFIYFITTLSSSPLIFDLYHSIM